MGHQRSALITGLTGQDGSFLAELLLDKGYRVTGLVRDAEAGDGGGRRQRPLGAAEHLSGQVELVQGDLLAPATLRDAIAAVGPDEIYHLAAPSFVPASWERPGETMRAIAGSTAAILEATRELGGAARVFVAASGAIFGDAHESPQNEDTPCRPQTPYAIAKLAAHQLVGSIREHYGVHASSGIAFNHESERRPERFVTRRVTRGAAAIALGRQDELALGTLDAVRDWSFAGDIMHAAWLMLQQESPATMCLRAASRTPSPSSLARPSRSWTWTPSATCASTPRSCGRPRAHPAWATRAGLARVWAGERRSPSSSSSSAWFAPTCARWKQCPPAADSRRGPRRRASLLPRPSSVGRSAPYTAPE